MGRLILIVNTLVTITISVVVVVSAFVKHDGIIRVVLDYGLSRGV